MITKHGVFKGLIMLALILLIIYALQELVPHDSTDNEVSGKRSGMRIRVDHATGVQYLITGGLLSGGGLCVRVRADGTPMLEDEDVDTY